MRRAGFIAESLRERIMTRSGRVDIPSGAEAPLFMELFRAG